MGYYYGNPYYRGRLMLDGEGADGTGGKKPNQQVEITLYERELDYDIGMITHVISNRETAAGATKEQGWNYSNTQDHIGEINLIARFKEVAVLELKAAFSKYLHEEELVSDDNLEQAYSDYTFVLDMPGEYNANFTKPLRSACHQFVVNRVLYDWFMRVKPDEAVLYRQLYEDAMKNVKSYMNKRGGRSRIKPYPLG